MGCIFCDIVSGTEKASIAFEDDESMAFLDRYPIDIGHCLLVPKKHYERITDMSSADVGSIFSKVPKLASIILQETGASAFSLGQNNGREAKQIIGHVHVHHDTSRGSVWTLYSRRTKKIRVSGKKARKERERRDSFAAKRIKQKRKNSLIMGAVLAAVLVIIGISSYNFITGGGIGQGSPENAGALGDEHVHASILTKIHGDNFDYSLPAYQIKSSWIHFEAQDGSTIHRHASGVTLEFLFNSVGIRLDENCFVFPDDRQFCTNEEFTLRYYIDGIQAESVNDLVFEDESRILISYGDNDLNRVDKELAELEDQPILS